MLSRDSWVFHLLLKSALMKKIYEHLMHTPHSMKSVGNVFAYEAMQLSKVMSGSKGRDKICALIQYSVDLYVQCMKHSQEYGEEVK